MRGSWLGEFGKGGLGGNGGCVGVDAEVAEGVKDNLRCALKVVGVWNRCRCRFEVKMIIFRKFSKGNALKLTSGMC